MPRLPLPHRPSLRIAAIHRPGSRGISYPFAAGAYPFAAGAYPFAAGAHPFAVCAHLLTTGSHLLAAGALLICLGTGEALAQTAVHDCLDDFGVAFIGGHSAAVANPNSVFLFGGPGGGAVLCDFPLEASAHALAESSLGEIWLTGTSGLILTTAAIAGPAPSSIGRGFLAGDLVFRFRVEPDNPGSTSPVDIDFTTRTWIPASDFSTAGAGVGSQSIGAEYRIRTLPAATGSPTWEYEDLAPISDTILEVGHTESVAVNVDRYFIVSLAQSTFTQGRAAPDGSAAGTLTSVSSFEASTDDDATIVWDIETQLGLTPELDSVPEPELGATLLLLAAIAADFARRRRGPRRTGVSPRRAEAGLEAWRRRRPHIGSATGRERAMRDLVFCSSVI